jgi:serine/threonine protein kinase/tetratricopeptide (TPR) repeat protein
VIGTKLGSYEIIEEIGKGGMATVYRAYQPTVGRHVAVKVIKKSIAEDEVSMVRFRREARLIARLEHPHLLPIYDFDDAHDPPYIVMRYMEGGTLKDVLRRGQIPFEEIGYLLRQIAAALDYAHRQGIVHRDIKPSNIMIDREGNAFVADFGIARPVAMTKADTGQDLTQSGSLIGTPDYMAPEQAMGREVSHQTDIYSLGVILFEMLTGQLPYQADSPMGVAIQHIEEPVPSACALNGSLPCATDEVLQRAMAKDPADRHQSVSELTEDIIAALGRTVTTAPKSLQAAAEESVQLITRERQKRQGEIDAVQAKFAEARGDAVDTDSQHTPTEQSKQVTAMFANIAEYAESIEAEDVEASRETLDQLWQQFESIIAERGGMLYRRTYDTALSLWGVETAREDDPEQAIHTALEMQEALRAFWDDDAEPLPMQIGITTGLVLLTPKLESASDTGRDYTISGPAISLANRLERVAPFGSILISHDTYRHVRGVFTVESGDPLRVRGRKRRLGTYMVRSAKPRAFRLSTRGVEGVETRMVGRAAELAFLQEAFYIAIEDNEAQMVTIVSEPGLGKSRLLYEFTNWAELEEVTYWFLPSRATPDMLRRPYALLRDLLSSYFEIQDSDSPATVREKLEAGVARITDLPDARASAEMAHYIGHLVGFDLSDSPYLDNTIDDPRQIHDLAEHQLVMLFVHAIRRYPVVIELHDIHWADESSLDTINRLITQSQKLPMLVICLARPELYDRRPAWGSGQPFHTRLDLRPLSKRESRRLVKEVLQKAEQVPDLLCDLIIDQAEGNPFYIEELIKVLIEDHVIVKEEPTWRIELGRLSGMRMPSTLTSLIQARLDNLFPAERIVLQRAAVIGRIFWDRAVHALGTADTQVIDDVITLNTLAERELVYIREESAFADTREYIFSSGVLRDVVYEGILGRQRRAYHRQVAQWLIEASAERMDEFAGLIADHLERAGELEQSVTYLRRAGEQAASQHACAEAVSYLNHALDLKAEGAPSECYALLMALYQVYEMTGNYPAASVAAQGAMSMAQACRDTISEAAGLLRWGQVLWHQGDYARAQYQLEQALDLIRALRVPSSASSEQQTAESLYCALSRDFGGFLVPFVARLCPSELNQALEADGLRTLGIISNARGEYTRAGEYHRQALAIFGQIGDQKGQASVLHNLGNVHRNQGDYDGARTHFQQALNIYQDNIGDKGGECLARACLGLIDHNTGDNQLAREQCQQALNIAQDIGDRHVQGYALTFMGHALLDLAQQPDDAALAWAAEVYEQALILREELAQRHLVMECRAGLARVSMAQDNLEQAQRQVNEILHYLETGTLDGTVDPLRVYLTCYQALRDTEPSHAREILTTAYDLLQERAWQIEDESLRRSYLEDVAAHREIAKEYARLEAQETGSL